MAGILQINNSQSIDPKKTHKKLSFTVGEQIIARVGSIDKLTNEAVLKLLDGWQFSAQLKEPITSTPEGIVKFQVEGYENGKLILKMLSASIEEAKENILSDTLEEQGINIKYEDYSIIEKMLKYKMSLTKENISRIKSLLDFQGKILADSKEENNFIMKYLDNKGIDINSEKGQNISDKLKGFFNEFKNMKLDEVMTFIENHIPLTEENIKSFNKLNKEPMSLYKDIIGLKGELIKDSNSGIAPKGIQEDLEFLSTNGFIKEESTGDNKLITPFKTSAYIQNAYETNEIKEIDKKEILKRLLDIGDSEESKVDDGVINGIGKNSAEDETITNEGKGSYKGTNVAEGESLIEDNLQSKNLKEMSIKLNGEKIETSQKVKDQVESKIREMQEIIRGAVEESNSSSETASKFIQSLQTKINDFKMFNSISNQYYYLDVPINLKDKEYPCKLIIKDDRKKGKKIDSTNVKFVATVKTVNIGVVDAYIKVNNNTLNINIKSEKSWVKVLEIGKSKIEKTLNNMGFITNVKFEEKEQEEVNLVQCRDFFEDSDFTRINLMV